MTETTNFSNVTTQDFTTERCSSMPSMIDFSLPPKEKVGKIAKRPVPGGARN